MERNWILFQRSSENEQIHIFLDLHGKQHVTSSGYSQLLFLFINTYHIAENEEQAKRIQKELNEIEEKLEQTFDSSGLGMFVGRIDSAARLEFIFYVQDGTAAKSVILSTMESYGSYRHYVQVREDGEWDFYTSLLPSQEEKMFARNSQIVRSLQYEGYKTGVSQRVHHQLGFVSKQELDEVKEKLMSLDYRVEHIENDPQGVSHKHKLHVSHHLVLSEPVLNETTKILYDMISGAGGRYEGWGIIPQEKAVRKWKKLVNQARIPAMLFGFAVICGAIGLVTVDSKTVRQSMAGKELPPPLAVGKKAPIIKLRDQNNNIVQIGGAGHPQMVHFCDASLEPCRKDLMNLQDLAKQEAAAQVQIISVCFPHATHDPLEQQLSFAIAHDKDGLDTIHAYKVRSYPVTFFINSTGIIVDVVEAGKPAQHDRSIALQNLN